MNNRQKAIVTIVPIICIILLLVANMVCNRTPEAGKYLYEWQCANCHFENGEGLADVIPSLAGSEFLEQNQSIIPCIIRDGINKEGATGKPDGQGMPGNPELSEGQIMNIINYINNAWGNDYGKVTIKEVGEWVEACGE